jgi:repressor LexA
MQQPLTTRQRQLLSFIESYMSEHNYPPSFEEMRSALGVSSLNAIAEMVTALERKGYIRRQPGRSRAIRIEKKLSSNEEPPLPPQRTEVIPILGVGTAENPLAALLRPRGLLSVDADFFALNSQAAWVAALVPDDAMASEGMKQGDVAIIEPTNQPHHGSVVYGYAGDQSFLRRCIERNGKTEFIATQRGIPPIRNDGRIPLTIIGIVRGILRRL